ncbi:MAG: hypothetical protein N4A57_13865 [Anaeromicrobium sp.]|uniref:hypothetical protein n=1 Tax=Anaeromicrobium sp. TaxID=1929132 RepID=UPI0025F393FC|nr:hypothetical protein [Anaeromicrobium sp.]MCT4595332.1 hypothetical protein [Anaeromicrobium sp.]
MFASSEWEELINEFNRSLGLKGDKRYKKKQETTESGEIESGTRPGITPAEILIIAGLLTGALQVFALTLDTSQQVQITLLGALDVLKRGEVDLEEIEDIGKYIKETSVEDFLKNMLKKRRK